jgi:hypothetical protein
MDKDEMGRTVFPWVENSVLFLIDGYINGSNKLVGTVYPFEHFPWGKKPGLTVWSVEQAVTMYRKFLENSEPVKPGEVVQMGIEEYFNKPNNQWWICVDPVINPQQPHLEYKPTTKNTDQSSEVAIKRVDQPTNTPTPRMTVNREYVELDLRPPILSPGEPPPPPPESSESDEESNSEPSEYLTDPDSDNTGYEYPTHYFVIKRASTVAYEEQEGYPSVLID